MTLTVSLPPDVEQAYRAEAQAKGIALDALMHEVLVAHVPSTPAEISAEEWVRQFREWTQSHASRLFS